MTRRIAALFVTAVFGLLAAIGLLLSSLGSVVLGVYVAVVLTGLALLVRKTRALKAIVHARSGRTCSCCTTSVFNPVEIR